MKHFFHEKYWVIKLLTVLKEVVIKRKIFLFLPNMNTSCGSSPVILAHVLWTLTEPEKTAGYSLTMQLQITQFSSPSADWFIQRSLILKQW